MMFQRTTYTTSTTANQHSTSADPLTARFGINHRLPKGLREEAAGMSWPLFTATYCPTPELKVSALDVETQRSGKLTVSAELTHSSKTQPPRTFRHEITATGAISACTHLLAEHGRYVEILTFRQHRIFEATVTFVEVAHQHNHRRTAWAVGFGPTADLSAAHALAAGAQRIHG